MADNGSGIFNRIHSWAEDAAAGIDIQAVRMDEEDDGFATALSNRICKDGQSIITANIPWNGNKITGLADGTDAGDAINLGQLTAALEDPIFADSTDDTKRAQLDMSGIATATLRTWAFPNASDTFVGTDVAQTLLNKSLQATTTYVVDASDDTKRARFSVSGITTETDRVITVPDADLTLVGTATPQLLTNKSLAAPLVVDPNDTSKEVLLSTDGITTETIRVVEFPDADGVLVLDTTAQTLTNKSFEADATFIVDESDATKRVLFDVSAVTTATDRTITVPDASLTLVGLDTAQTLTNKTLTAPVLDDPTIVDPYIRDGTDATKQVLLGTDGITTGTTRAIGFPDDDGTLVLAAATQTLANKSLVADTTAIVDQTDPTKQAQFSAAGITTATTRTYDLPDVSGTIVVGNTSADGLSLIAAADYAAMRGLLDLEVGTDVQAYDADLTAIAALTSAADKVPYATGAGTWALADFTAAARSVLDDADVAAMLSTLTGGLLSASGSDVTITYSNDGSGAGPFLYLKRVSATPAANDFLGEIRFIGVNNNAEQNIPYAGIFGLIRDTTDGSEDGYLAFRTMRNGTATNEMQIEGGVVLTGATGGALGVGSLNAAVLRGATVAATSTFFLTKTSSNFAAAGVEYDSGLMRFTAAGTPMIDLNRVNNGAVLRTYLNSVQAGSIAVTAGGETTFNTTSDEAFKNFTGLYDPDEAIAIIRADPVRTWTWVGQYGGGPGLGWGAQTSYAVSPALATPGTGEPGSDDYTPWSLDKSARTPYLWAAMSKVLDRLDALEAEVAALKGQ